VFPRIISFGWIDFYNDKRILDFVPKKAFLRIINFISNYDKSQRKNYLNTTFLKGHQIIY